jgi:hypothetical protein
VDETELVVEVDDEVWDVDDIDDALVVIALLVAEVVELVVVLLVVEVEKLVLELLEVRAVSKYSSSLFPAPQYS